jgi:hypothetical protein
MSSKANPAKQPSAPPSNECPSRPLFDFAKVDAAIPVRMLSKTWSNDARGKTLVLGPQPHVAVNHKPQYVCRWPLEWFDAQTGAKGVGAVTLVAHVQKITLDEAARRLVEFARVHIWIRSSHFETDTAEAA